VNGYLDDIPVDQVRSFEKEFLDLLRTQHFDVLTVLEKEITKEVEETMKRLITALKERKGYSAGASDKR
jgi:F0F1-type ATP synthase alpha subunit